MFSLPAELITVVVAALPVSEVRGAIPLSIAVYGFLWWEALGWSLAGNGAVFFVLFPLLHWFLQWSEQRWPGLHQWLVRTAAHRHARHRHHIEQWKQWALFLLVAAPLPVTGAWTGTLIAVVAGFSFREAVWPVTVGVLTAGVVVTVLTTGVLAIV